MYSQNTIIKSETLQIKLKFLHQTVDDFLYKLLLTNVDLIVFISTSEFLPVETIPVFRDYLILFLVTVTVSLSQAYERSKFRGKFSMFQRFKSIQPKKQNLFTWRKKYQ